MREVSYQSPQGRPLGPSKASGMYSVWDWGPLKGLEQGRDMTQVVTQSLQHRRNQGWSRQDQVGGHCDIPGRHRQWLAPRQWWCLPRIRCLRETLPRPPPQHVLAKSHDPLPHHTFLSTSARPHRPTGLLESKLEANHRQELKKAPTYSMAGGSRIQLQPSGTYIMKIFLWQEALVPPRKPKSWAYANFSNQLTHFFGYVPSCPKYPLVTNTL